MTVNIQSILVPLDGSPASEQALPWAQDLAARHGAGLTLLRVIPHPNILAVQDLQHLRAYYSEQEQLAETYLKDVQSRWLESNPNVSLLHVPGYPPDVIVTKAAELGTSVVVMTSHGRDGITRWLLGSVAERVARHCTCPVLLVRPPQ